MGLRRVFSLLTVITSFGEYAESLPDLLELLNWAKEYIFETLMQE